MVKYNKLISLAIILFASIAVLANLLGIVIESLFTFEVLNVPGVNIRELSPISVVLALSVVVLGLMFIIAYKKKGKRTRVYWDILMALILLEILYKLIRPTYLVNLIPYYYLISIFITLAIWLTARKKIQKIQKEKIELFSKENKE